MKQGMKFPPQIDPVTGRFLEAELEESVKDSIYLILMTQREERSTRPEFGCDMTSYTFTDMTPTVTHMLAQSLEDAILSQEPRIADVDIRVDKRDREACLHLQINYTLSEGGGDQVMIPFYINGSR